MMKRKMLFNDIDVKFYSRALVLRSSGDLEKKIETSKNAIAVTGISSGKKCKVKFLALDGAEPSKENIAKGKYPLFRPLYLMTQPNPSPKVKKFLDWILSSEGQKIISEQGTVNLEEGKELVEKYKHWEHLNLVRNNPKSNSAPKQ
jgi:phosphate transport system substrate-binding protein